MRNTLHTVSRKVPEITAVFWLAKLLTTAMGEATSDFLANTISPYLAVAIGFAVFVFALWLQFRAKRYIPWVYWFAVAMVAVFGTMAADVLHKQFGVPYTASTAFFAICLAAVFVVWQKVERSLSIHTITTPRREAFYWLTVVTTFALGTAAGDWTAYSLGLGYLSSGVLFAAVMLVPVVGRYFKLNEVLTFWFAYIVTRPLGASFADWVGKPMPHGLGHGDGTVSVALTILITLCVAYMTFNRHERNSEHVSPA
ncbi:MAG: COG4705 family protein [Candidatus Saccharimonadales bacterium]